MSGPAPSEVAVPNVLGQTQALIDVLEVTTSAGLVAREVVSIGDPAVGDQWALVDLLGNLSVKEAVPVDETDASTGTLGTIAAVAIEPGIAKVWIDIMNVSNNGNFLGYSYDGSTPGFVDGQALPGTKVLTPYGSQQYDHRIPQGPLQIVGSAPGTVVTIKYA